MPKPVYRWWPAVSALDLEVSDRAVLVGHLLNVTLVTAGLCLPVVVHATGLSPITVIAIVSLHILWTLLVFFAIRPSIAPTALRFHVGLAGSVLLNTMITVAFPALGGDPQTPLWMLPVMYACFNGAMQEVDPSVGVLGIHLGIPLLAIPLLIARGADPGWSIAAPLLCSAISGVGYNQLAQMSAMSRRARRERDDALARLRDDLEAGTHAKLARDLHDSLGSSLAIIGLFGDLIERHVDRPDELRAIAGMVREASSEGTSELAALVGGIMVPSADLDGIAATIVETARRGARSSGWTIDVRVVQGGHVRLAGDVRLTLVRVFQEAVHNALEHGNGSRIVASFTADADSVVLDIVDDGIGFVPTTASTGHGLSGMRARVSELAGTFTLTTSPGSGVRIRVALPCGA